MERITATCVLTLCLAGCLPGSGSGSETSGDEAVQVGRWVEANTTDFGADNVMGLLVNGSGGAKLFYVAGATQVFELTAIVSWDEPANGEFALQLVCEERHRRDANGGNRQRDTCVSYESFDLTCPVPDEGDGAQMTCTSPTPEWQTYPFRWVRTSAAVE
jgi:hypothetical protein